MDNKIVTARFATDDNYVNVYDVYQWDYGQVLRIEGLKLPNMVEIHFSLEETSGEAKTRIGVTKDGVTDVVIPDGFLENEGIGDNYKIFVWVYVADKESGSTEYKITIHVKARAKPEITHGGQDGEVFQEAVEAVRDAAKRAAESEKQAEGYAHGREDIPERAEDNAMYYAGKASEDAKKTARDRAEVERLVESVSGIDEQVAKVEKLSKDAQEAATQAGTSAEQAELHKQAAETASSAAQTAAQETEADRTSVEKTKETVENLSAQVQKNKESVDKTAQDFALNTQQALADVNNAGQTQTERVQTAGNTVVENIKTAQDTATRAVETAKTEAVKAVQTEGNKQVKAVADKGKEVLEAIPNFDAKLDTKLDKNQGAEHAGKALVVGEDGNVVPGKPQTEGVGDAADAIVNTASGTLLNIKDSAERKNKGFGMSGKTEQVQTTGVQLFDRNTVTEGILSETGDIATGAGFCTSDFIPVKSNENYYCTKTGSKRLKFFDINKRPIQTNNFSDAIVETGGTFTTGDTTKYIRLSVTIEMKEKLMLNSGTTKRPYEPYSGGKPSPSPEYPQEIVNAGKLNEDTGKYEIDVTINSGNLFKVIEHTSGYYVDKDGKVQIAKTLGYSWTAAVNNLQKQTVTLHVTTAINTRCRLYCTDLQNTILYKHEDSGANTNDNSHTFNMPDGAKKIYVSVMEIDSAEQAEITLNLGNVTLPYEPYKEQTLIITSDRPLTKWDRLVEQDGQIGWLYATKYIENLAEIIRDNTPIYGTEQKYFNVLFENEKFNYSMEKVVSETGHYKANKELYTIDVKKNTFLIKINADDTIQTAKEHLHYSVMYNTTQTEFVPLPQSEQDTIRALQTYYPTTVVSNSEDTEMQLTYVADTKNYTDRKIEQAVSAQTQSLANLLSLMPLSTQAAMIEADTNNILDNMEVQK